MYNQKLRIMVVGCVVLFASLMQAQKAEVLINKAAESLKKSNYQEAITQLEKAQKAIEKQYANELIGDLLPFKLNEYELNKSASESLNRIDQNSFYITRLYGKSKDNSVKKSEANDEGLLEALPIELQDTEQQLLKLVFTNKTASVVEVQQSHNQDKDVVADLPVEEGLVSNVQSIKVKGYRAILQYDESQKQGRISVIVGATVVQVLGVGIDNEDILYQFMDSVDFDKVVSKFGA